MSQPSGPQQQQPYPPQYGQQPQYPAAPVPPVKKKSKTGWLIAGAIVLVLMVIGAALGGGGGRPSGGVAGTTPTTAQQPAAQPPAAQPEAPAKVVVVYEVTGAGTANNITYVTDGMTSTQQEQGVKLPWSKTIELPAGQALQMVSLVAQAGEGTPNITAKITANGKVVKEGKSSGLYAVVTVNDNIGTLK